MEKNYLRMQTMVILSCLVSSHVLAQLSGTVTIDNTAPASTTNFTSFTSFAQALGTQGVNGPLTANVGPFSNTYNEQVQFGQIAGASSVNRIVINGNGRLITFNSTNFSQPWTVGLNGTDYLTVNNLNIQATGSPYAWATALYSGADYNTFSSCTFSVPANNTSTNGIPFVISGSGSSLSNGMSGEFNKILNCSTFSGYYGIAIYGNFSQPYTRGNEIIGCTIRDFYSHGIYNYYYVSGGVIRRNDISCPNRTNTTTKGGIYCFVVQGMLIEQNNVHHLFNPNIQTSTNTSYGIWCRYNIDSYWTYNNLPSTMPNTIRNNLVTDITHNGTLYGIDGYGMDGYIYNNTISLDYTGTTSGSTTYGIYSYGDPGYFSMYIHNNIIKIGRAGTGTKYAYYNASFVGGSDVVFDRNDIYITSTGGTNYYGNHTGPAVTHAGLQSQGANVTGFSVDPMFTSAADFHPTNNAINNAAIPKGLIVDQQNMPRSGTTPDIGALEFLSLACAGTPSANGLSVPNYVICPGETADLGLLNYYSDTGITYQWQTSTASQVGPFTAIQGATTVVHTTTPLTGPIWYQIVMTCTNGGGSISPVAFLNVVANSYSTVPYYESFESIPKSNKLPNCSWTASNLGSSSLTYTNSSSMNRQPRSGNKFASFFYSPAGTQAFYSNAIWMNAGVTYSASVWFTTDYYGYDTWDDLSITVGQNQNTTGEIVVATTNGPAISSSYKSLSNTYMVPTSGWYFVGIKATSGGNCCADYLTWDDLRIEIPCQLGSNTPTVSVTAPATICQGQTAILSASGAHTYLWSNGATSNSIGVTPNTNANYMVTAEDTLSGCPVIISKMITVNPTPFISVIQVPSKACEGMPLTMHATGAATYTWSTGHFGNAVTFVPTSGSTYSVQGSNSFGCNGMGMISVQVNAPPAVVVSGPTSICEGETAIFIGQGASSYEWSAVSSFFNTGTVVVSPMVSTAYTVTGTDANGCKKTIEHQLMVDPCAGLHETSLRGLNVYPNPANDAFVVELNNGNVKHIEVNDVTGRKVITLESSATTTPVRVAGLAKGIYYIKITSESDYKVIKLVKE
jgi:hypothetical protein